MALLKQSTARNRMFLMVDSTDHVTGKTGLTVTLTLSKDGGSFAAAGGSVSEVSSGWYKVALNTTDTNTLGDLAYHATGTGADPTDFTDQVTAELPGILAATGLDNIAVTDPGAPGSMTTIPKMVVGLWRWFYKKTTLTSTQLKTFADDNSTVNGTATVSDDGTTQTKGALS